jgi:outer membrane protein assembly factor BamB
MIVTADKMTTAGTLSGVTNTIETMKTLIPIAALAGIFLAPLSVLAQEPGTLLWEFDASSHLQEPMRRIISSPAIGTDGTVYIGSGDGKLYAITPDGAKKWEFKMTGGGGISSSPAIGVDGNVYVGSSKGIYALDGKTGSKRWEFLWVGSMHSSPAIGVDGTVYVGSNDGRIFALDGKTGAGKWEFRTGNMVHSSPAIGADRTIYVGSGDNKVYALEGKNGATKWEFQAGYFVSSSPAIGADGTVYVGTEAGKFFALDGQTRAKKWEYVNGGNFSSSPAIGTEGTVYIGGRNNRVYALDGKSGTKQWVFETGEDVRSSPAIGDDGTVYVGSHDNKVYALNGKTGAKKWQFTTGGYVESSPAIGNDGTVFVGSNDGKIYALKTSSTGPADSPWPMFGQNAQRTGRDEPAHTLTVASLNPDNGAKVTVSQVDSERKSSGITQFTQEYPKGAKVTLIAERVAGDNRFKHWLKNGEPVSTEPTVTVTLDWDYTLRAVYEPGPAGDPDLKLFVSRVLSNQDQITIQAVGKLRKPFEMVELELSYDLIHWETQDLQLPINLPLSFPLAQDMQFIRVKRIKD